MSKNWKRHIELQLLDNEGKGIDLGSFKVVFNIDWFNISSSSRIGNFKIYNLSSETASRITGREFSRVRVVAGYDGIYEVPVVDESELNKPREITEAEAREMTGENFGLIFSGQVRYAVRGRDNPTDTYVMIQAADTDQAFSSAITSKTISKGYTVADVRRAAMSDFNPYGVTPGVLGDAPATVFPRGKTLLTMTRNVMDNVAAQCKATWQFVDGQLNMVPDSQYVHEAVRLNSATGLVGMPQQTIGSGVNVRCLINPNIRLNGLIQLDQASVYRAALANNSIANAGGPITDHNVNGNIYLNGTQSQPASIATDGIYVVRGIMYSADTRGQAWYQDMMCFARGDMTLLSGTALQRGA